MSLGARGLDGPPGEKPHIPQKMIVDMKGSKGEQGYVGKHGFTGPRGL